MFKKNIVSLIIYFYSELNASSHISPRFSHRYIPILSSRSTLYIIINKKGTKFLMPKYLNMIFSNIIKIIRLARCDTRYNMKYYIYIYSFAELRNTASLPLLNRLPNPVSSFNHNLFKRAIRRPL